jgi:peptidoglycan/xylan/chitin deacetylase (PgdA/CDA1 family)
VLLSGLLEGSRENARQIRQKTFIGLQRSLHYSGVARLGRYFGAHSGFLALMYHSVPGAAHADFVDPAWAIPEDLFEQQLQLLAENCHVVSLAQAHAFVMGDSEPLPPRSVVLTFDDGYLDNLEVAAPLLRKYQMPATIFVPTGYIDRQEPQWIDELHCAFRFRQNDKIRVAALPSSFDLSNEHGQRHAYLCLSTELLRHRHAERRRLLDEIKSQLQPSRAPPRLTLSWAELRSMRQTAPDIEIGLHGHDHDALATLALEEATAEVRLAQERFEAEMGYRARYISYPYGRYSEALRGQLAALGLVGAFKTQPTQRIEQGSDPWAMPRYEVTRSLVDFRLWSEGVLPDLGKRLFGRVVDQV